MITMNDVSRVCAALGASEESVRQGLRDLLIPRQPRINATLDEIERMRESKNGVTTFIRPIPDAWITNDLPCPYGSAGAIVRVAEPVFMVKLLEKTTLCQYAAGKTIPQDGLQWELHPAEDAPDWTIRQWARVVQSEAKKIDGVWFWYVDVKGA